MRFPSIFSFSMLKFWIRLFRVIVIPNACILRASSEALSAFLYRRYPLMVRLTEESKTMVNIKAFIVSRLTLIVPPLYKFLEDFQYI